ncbi:hypothetical protein EWB00_001827 [Schistosoma japonicum]|uniref:Uncharacterized protein n=1 Tax=Schistosoma japonicum TaxID=6182 RepID=A0A4Z2DEE5_SCHJA|nr:hypothetical protein EWB00_001827 [Schistosoma japonicum]
MYCIHYLLLNVIILLSIGKNTTAKPLEDSSEKSKNIEEGEKLSQPNQAFAFMFFWPLLGHLVKLACYLNTWLKVGSFFGMT